MQDISLHVLDVAENGVGAGASLVRISVVEDTLADVLRIVIEDNGRGMEPQFLAEVFDPFVTTRTTRRVGLGLPLFRQSAHEAEGDLVVDSVAGVGSRVSAWMKHSHIDRRPMGNMTETMVTLIRGERCGRFRIFTHEGWS